QSVTKRVARSNSAQGGYWNGLEQGGKIGLGAAPSATGSQYVLISCRLECDRSFPLLRPMPAAICDGAEMSANRDHKFLVLQIPCEGDDVSGVAAGHRQRLVIPVAEQVGTIAPQSQ